MTPRRLEDDRAAGLEAPLEPEPIHRPRPPGTDPDAPFGVATVFCMDSSVIPTSLGVNPSLTIAAVCERAATELVARAPDFDLPRRPEGFAHGRPPQRVGPRVKPG